MPATGWPFTTTGQGSLIGLPFGFSEFSHSALALKLSDAIIKISDRMFSLRNARNSLMRFGVSDEHNSFFQRFMVRYDVKRPWLRQLFLIAKSDLEHTSFEVLRGLCSSAKLSV